MRKLLRKLLNLFLYCGVSREEYISVKEDAYTANFQAWKIFNTVALFVMFLMLCAGIPNYRAGAEVSLFILRGAFFVYFVVMTVLYHRVLKPQGIAAQLLIYLTMILLLGYGLYLGIFYPTMTCTVFIVLLVLLPLFMIDNPYYMALVLVCAAITYSCHAVVHKTGAVLRTDIVYVIAFALVGIVINIFYNMLRVREFLAKRRETLHAEEIKRSYEKSLGLYSVISALTEDYDILSGVNYDEGTIEYFRVNQWTGLPFSDERAEQPLNMDELFAFAKEFVVAEDFPIFREGVRKKNIMACVAEGKICSCRFRIKRDGQQLWYELRAVASPDIGNGRRIVAGIRNVDEEVRAEEARVLQEKQAEFTSQLAVIADLSRDFAAISYVTLNTDRFSDSIRHFRVGKKLLKLFPDWREETFFHSWLETFMNSSVTSEDRQAFFAASRRDVILNGLEMEDVYSFNFRLAYGAEAPYYQIKYAADRDEEGVLRGYTVGIRSVDAEMRDRIRHEEELTAINERAEHTIARRTAELREKNAELMRTGEEIIELLGDVVEMRDSGSGQHVRRVKAYTRILAERVRQDLPEYNLTEQDVSYIAGASALHDIGKIMISDTILLKPAALTVEEFDIMKTHCEKGCEILLRSPRNWDKRFLDLGMQICRYHHEKWNGGGYPYGLKGDDIPIAAQIVSVADCFDALTSERPYKKAFSASRAVSMIVGGECGAFSERLMNSFRTCVPLFEEALKDPGFMAVADLNPVHTSIHGTRLSGLHILLVDDSELSLSLNEDILQGESASTVSVTGGADALEAFITKGPFDAVLTDLFMPGMDGFELCERLRAIERRSPIRTPIIALTAENSMENSSHAIRCGVDACLSKPLVVAEFTRVLLDCMRRRNESIGKMLSDTVAVANTDALTHVKSITAYTDMVSNLSNELRSDRKPEFAIVMCDLNGLKNINDTYGHSTGDIFIRNCCHIICHVFADSPVYRIGGDEFVVLLRDGDFDNRNRLMEELAQRNAEAEEEKDIRRGHASFAAGISVFNPTEDTSVSEVVKRADRSMYRNKALMRQRNAAQ